MDTISFNQWLSEKVSKKVKSDILSRIRKIEMYYSIDLDDLSLEQINNLKENLKSDENFINNNTKYQINTYIYALNKYLLFRG